MTTTPTFDASGLRTLTLEEIRENLREALVAAGDLGPEVSTGANTIVGMLLDVCAAAIEDCYRLIDDLWASWDFDQAEGVAQDALLYLRGMVRLAAQYSQVTLTLTGTPATVVPAGYRAGIASGGAYWALDADATIGGGGTVDAVATCTVTGPVEAAPGAITEIIDAYGGWTAVTNAASATLGTDVETPAAARIRAITASTGSTTEEAIYSRLVELDDVTGVGVTSNRSGITDAHGTPGHTMWVVVHPSTADAQQVAETIWGEGGAAGGIDFRGDEEATITDANGEQQTMRWDWATDVDTHVYVAVTTDDDYPADGDDGIEDAVIAYFTTIRVAQDVYPAQIAAAVVTAVVGIKTIVVGVKEGSTAGAGDTSPITIEMNEYADLDETDVVVVSS